jgi:hypothetical protein
MSFRYSDRKDQEPTRGIHDTAQPDVRICNQMNRNESHDDPIPPIAVLKHLSILPRAANKCQLTTR